EDFLPRYGHLVANIREYGRVHKVTFAEALRTTKPADYQICTLFNPLLDQALDFFELTFTCERSDAGAIREWVANFCTLSGSLCRNVRRCHLGAGNQQASRRITRLTGVAKTRLHALLDRILEVGVVQNNVGRLAS